MHKCKQPCNLCRVLLYKIWMNQRVMILTRLCLQVSYSYSTHTGWLLLIHFDNIIQHQIAACYTWICNPVINASNARIQLEHCPTCYQIRAPSIPELVRTKNPAFVHKPGSFCIIIPCSCDFWSTKLNIEGKTRHSISRQSTYHQCSMQPLTNTDLGCSLCMLLIQKSMGTRHA